MTGGWLRGLCGGREIFLGKRDTGDKRDTMGAIVKDDESGGVVWETGGTGETGGVLRETGDVRHKTTIVVGGRPVYIASCIARQTAKIQA